MGVFHRHRVLRRDHVRDVAGLTAAWAKTVRAERGSLAPITIMVITPDGRPLRRLIRIRRLPDDPMSEVVDDVVAELTELIVDLIPQASVAVLTAMTSEGLPDEHELAWCRLFSSSLSRSPFLSWPLCHASRDIVGLVPPDGLVA